MSSPTELRAEIDARQAVIGDLLREVEAEQLLMMEPANLAWFAGCPLARGILDPLEQPALILHPTQRWLVSSNFDSQRLFDLFLDGLGFQLKEWPWQIGKDQLLADLCQSKVVAADRLLRDAKPLAEKLRLKRLELSPLARTALRALGADLAHAIEATCRNFERGTSEQEVTGHLGHRMLHRGLEPVIIQVAGDGRLGRDGRPTFTAEPVNHSCTVIATARRDGVHASAARTVRFGPTTPEEAKTLEVAGPVQAARVAMCKAGSTIRNAFDAGQGIAAVLKAEHTWRDSPGGWFTGRLPNEGMLVPASLQLFADGHAIVWQSRIGSSLFLDTYVAAEFGAEDVTPPEEWPVRRYKLPDKTIDLPDVLVR